MSDGKMWEIEDGFFSGGVGTICGVDEAGRGPLAGPVYAAAVILPPHLDIPGLTDSKKLTDKKRRELFPIIQEQAIAYGIGFATEKEIDEINILQATFLAMERALGQLAVKPDLVLIDGNREKNYLNLYFTTFLYFLLRNLFVDIGVIQSVKVGVLADLVIKRNYHRATLDKSHSRRSIGYETKLCF